MFTVISDFEVCGKTKGDLLTSEELSKAGVNVEALITAGHIQEVNAKTKPESKEGATL